MNIDTIWNNVLANEGKVFHQIKGKAFTYTANNSKTSISLGTTNQSITKNLLEKAVMLLPFSDTVPLQHLRSPSYLYAILTHKRIILSVHDKG